MDPATITPTGSTSPGADRLTRLSDTDTIRVMELLGGADSVELKTSVESRSQREAITRLPLDPVEAQPRAVTFFDTPDLALDAAGVVVRVRRMPGGRADSVVKLRPVDAERLSPDERQSGALGVELDALPGGYVCSASMKGRATSEVVQDVTTGRLPLRKALSKEQRAFFTAHAPADVALDDLVALGPTFVLKAVFPVTLVQRRDAPQRRMVAELWLLPNGDRVLEISLKCLPSEAFQVAAETRAWLDARGVPITDVQGTKTRTVLTTFAARLAAEAHAAAEADADSVGSDAAATPTQDHTPSARRTRRAGSDRR